MRVIAHNTLVEFWETHSATKSSLAHWYRVATAAKWGSIREVLAESQSLECRAGSL